MVLSTEPFLFFAFLSFINDIQKVCCRTSIDEKLNFKVNNWEHNWYLIIYFKILKIKEVFNIN